MPVTNTGAESNGVSAHGTTIKRNGVTVAEVLDITLPPLSRKPIETTTHNSDDDSYVVGVRRKGELQFSVNWLPSGETTHDATSGLLDAWATGSKDRYDVIGPDADPYQWIFSGFVTNIAPKAPVDGAQMADISIRPSGGEIFLP